MRAARLLSVVLLLQGRESMTAAELAKELEVSERTIVRDMLALSEAGVPVYAERGRKGGYRLLGGYRSRLTGLHRGEAEAVFLAGMPGPAQDMGLGAEVAAARLKLSVALAPAFQDAPSRIGQRFHLDAPQWFKQAPAPSVLPELARAVRRDLRVVVDYRRGERGVVRDLEPYGLVLKAGSWYLAARTTAGAFLVYKVDRFDSLRVSEQGFSRVEEFDLARFWEQRAAEFARSLLKLRVLVRLTADGFRILRATGEPAAVEEILETITPPDEQGWVDGQGMVTVSLPVESMDVAYHQLLRLGPEAEVLEPVELRARFADTVRRWAALYPADQRYESGSADLPTHCTSAM